MLAIEIAPLIHFKHYFLSHFYCVLILKKIFFILYATSLSQSIVQCLTAKDI